MQDAYTAGLEAINNGEPEDADVEEVEQEPEASDVAEASEETEVAEATEVAETRASSAQTRVTITPSVLPEPEPLAEEAPATTAPYVPAFPGFAALPEAEQERLNELAILNPAQAMYEIAQRVSQQQAMVSVATAYHLQEAQAKAPGFFRVHGPRVQEALAQMPADVRGTKQGIDNAMAYALILEGQTTGDMVSAIRRAATLFGDEKAKPTAVPKVPAKPVLNASQRTPAPAMSRPAAATPTRSGNARADNTIKVLMDMHGLSRAEAERAAREM